jgi:hypothetical protein
MTATLVRAIQHPTDWFNDLRRDLEYVFETADHRTESVSEYYTPRDCRAIGCQVTLHYVYFTLGPAEGYHYEPTLVKAQLP